MIWSSLFLNRLSCSTFLMATISPVSTTLASKTTPKDPFPMIRSAAYEIFCSLLEASGSDAAAPVSAMLDDVWGRIDAMYNSFGNLCVLGGSRRCGSGLLDLRAEAMITVACSLRINWGWKALSKRWTKYKQFRAESRQSKGVLLRLDFFSNQDGDASGSTTLAE